MAGYMARARKRLRLGRTCTSGLRPLLINRSEREDGRLSFHLAQILDDAPHGLN